MKVLIACEFSGVVRDAFMARGHIAWSCDLLGPSEGIHKENHYCGDVTEILDAGWDLMIAHPPCTYLCKSGVRWLYGGKGTVIDRNRWQLMKESAQLFRDLWLAPIPRIAIENPQMHGHGRIAIFGEKRKPDQSVQPWQFGHGEIKETCFWLKNLPCLKSTNIVEGRQPRVHYQGPGKDRWKERSRTLAGIADAMAAQWGFANQLSGD